MKAHDTFLSGDSIYGSPAQPGAADRVVDLDTAKRVHVDWGETLTFRAGGHQFSWRFDGLDRRSVDVQKLAPEGFPARRFIAYIGRNPANRH